MSQEAISAPCPSIFEGSISSRKALTQKVIDEMVIVYYIFDGKFFSKFLNVQTKCLDTQSQVLSNP